MLRRADQHLRQAIAVEIVEGHPGQGVLLRYLKCITQKRIILFEV